MVQPAENRRRDDPSVLRQAMTDSTRTASVLATDQESGPQTGTPSRGPYVDVEVVERRAEGEPLASCPNPEQITPVYSKWFLSLSTVSILEALFS